MLVELDKLREVKGVDFPRHGAFEVEYMMMKWKQLPAVLDTGMQGYFSLGDMIQLVIGGHQEELAQALERNKDVIHQNTSLSEFLECLARFGCSDPFARIGSLIPDGWTTGGSNIWGRKLMPYLLIAAQRRLPNPEVIGLLVERFGADVNVQFTDDMGQVTEMSLSSRVAADRLYKPGDTILHYLARGGHWWYQGAIKYLPEHGADPNARDKQGKTPLCRALQVGDLGRYGQRGTVQVLLEGGADPNIAASCGWTPLAMAAHDINLVNLLLQYGARPSKDHPMELFGALGWLNLDVLSTFLDLGTDCNTTVLSAAQPHWHTSRVRKPPSPPDYVLYPLHYISMSIWNASSTRDHAVPLIKHLLARGADPYLVFNGNRTIIHEAIAAGGLLQPYFELEGLDLERRDGHGRTLLLAAACCTTGTDSYAHRTSLLASMDESIRNAQYEEGDPTRALTLYERGADLTAVDNLGNNVLHLLAEHKDPKNEDREEEDPGKKYWVEEHKKGLSLFVERAPELALQRNNSGNTPWDIAYKANNVWVLDVLSEPECT